ncbi:MAG TPA: cob(I)yrinic acid a,c-diamide adenosyltransferase [Patescibacteria group bacterium]|jgi:cob(I)alamin adenosyltransferase|nr:cob(I)yrinic acid a,c-diamide adenosyltransferase [Patescibacteria group bacterium]
MPKLTKIYTRTGDDGTTALGTRTRVSKANLRVRAFGDVDELNSLLGLALAAELCAELAAEIPKIQHELFNLGSELAFPAEGGTEVALVPGIASHHVENLEQLIDELNASVGPLENFILPGGSPGAAHLQVARAVCRRAERNIVALAQEENIGEQLLRYMNRLSDTLFVMARFENKAREVEEPIWNTLA